MTAAAGKPGCCSGGSADAHRGPPNKAITASAATNNQDVFQRFIDHLRLEGLRLTFFCP
jgi:hypothetical protein